MLIATTNRDTKRQIALTCSLCPAVIPKHLTLIPEHWAEAKVLPPPTAGKALKAVWEWRIIWHMKRAIVSAVAVAALVLSVSGPSSASPTRAGSFYGRIELRIRGWGIVGLGRGFGAHGSTMLCRQRYCRAESWATSGAKAVVTASPMTGWKLGHWRGACNGKRPQCTIDLTRVPPDAQGHRHAWLTAMFVAAVPGFSRSWQVPLGRTGPRSEPAHGLLLRINSVTPDATLRPAPPRGSGYFVANVTATFDPIPSYAGYRSLGFADSALFAIGRQNHSYNASGFGCPSDGPAPQLASLGPINSGQSATGNVCWTIATSDATSLAMYFANREGGHTYKTWFALH